MREALTEAPPVPHTQVPHRFCKAAPVVLCEARAACLSCAVRGAWAGAGRLRCLCVRTHSDSAQSMPVVPFEWHTVLDGEPTRTQRASVASELL